MQMRTEKLSLLHGTEHRSHGNRSDRRRCLYNDRLDQTIDNIGILKIGI